METRRLDPEFPGGLFADHGRSSWWGLRACFEHSVSVRMQVKWCPSFVYVATIQTPGGGILGAWTRSFSGRLSVDLPGEAVRGVPAHFTHLVFVCKQVELYPFEFACYLCLHAGLGPGRFRVVV